MTKEELEKESEKYVKQNYCEMCVMADDCKSGCIDCFTVQAYIASAEPREKQIQIDAEQIRALQKQNGELTDRVRELEYQLTHRNCLDCSNHSSKLRMRTLDLEKENAELKKKQFSLRNERNTFLAQNEQYEKDLANFNEQLTKAKELIKLLLMNCVGVYESTGKTVAEIQAEAEQFLKDSEVEK